MTDGGDPEQRPTGAPGGSYSGLPPSGDFDELTRKAGGLRSRRSMLGLAGAAIVAGIVAWFVWGRGGSRCTTASSCGDRHYCDEDETCICTETAEGDIKCGQLPPYCEVPLCTTSADCAHLGEGFFCDTPNSGCCNDGHLSRCIAPCGAEYPPPPTTTTTSTTVPPEEGSEEEPDDEPQTADDGEPAHLRRTETQPDGVLFFTRREDGTAAYFYGQEGRGGVLQPTHVVFEDEDGALATVIVDDEMLPVNWTASTLSMAARAESRDTVLDPSDALHSIIVESEEWTLRANLVPKDLAGAVTAAEELTEERFRGAREVVADAASWTALVEAAREAGDDQPQHIANALGVSIAHAVAVIMAAAEEIEIESEEGEASDEGAAPASTVRALPVSAPRAILPIYKFLSDLLGPLLESMVKNALLNLAAEPLAPTAPTDPTVPTFDLLLCQGATSWGTVCHYTFFDRENIMGCLDFCKTDLSCFNNICAPITLAVEDVMQSW